MLLLAGCLASAGVAQLGGSESGTPIFTTLGEADAPGERFWRPGLSAATGIPGHVVQHITLAAGSSQIMLTKDGGKTYLVVENVSNVADMNENHPHDLGTVLPPPRKNATSGRTGQAWALAGQFTTLAAVRSSSKSTGGADSAVLQTWVDSADGLKMTGNASATFYSTPAAFLASAGCQGAAGGDGTCWLSSSSQTIIRTANDSLLLSRYGYASDGKKICGGGTRLCSTLAFYGSEDGRSWHFVSRIDASTTMTAPDPRHGHSSKGIEGPGQASLALLGDGRIMTVFRLGPGTTGGNESTISPFYPGGNQGLNLWKAYSLDSGATWTTPVAVTGCRGVRHDPKGVWPQLLMLSNGVLTLTTGRPNLAYWISSVSKSKTDPTANPVADGECWNYAGFSASPVDSPYGKKFGTSGYTGVAEPEPGVLLIAYDQLPVGAVGAQGLERVYSIRVNLTKHK